MEGWWVGREGGGKMSERREKGMKKGGKIWQKWE
nr:MAG TPA: hypothetical protein [Caudoviricetes sp.]